MVAAVAVAAFVWAARNDQYEDLDTPPVRILMDDAPVVVEVESGGEPDAPHSNRSGIARRS
ncbi:MAG: cbb3-type cytochrome oxidase assembly protein CcoS [Phycisphaerales bacterium]|nr:cbb3-type cytochrome oxidase assembly protein CcoS [Phycisphaerales bacterium]